MATRELKFVFQLLLVLTLSSLSEAQERRPKAVPSVQQKVLTSLPKTVRDVELKASTGGSFKISDYSGSGLVVMLWASWCEPCRLQLASLARSQGELRARGIEVIALSTEDPDASAEVVSDLIRQYGVNYQVGWATSAVSLRLMQGRDAIPQSFVISRSSRIVRRFVGFNATLTPPQLELAIQEVLNENSDLPKRN